MVEGLQRAFQPNASLSEGLLDRVKLGGYTSSLPPTQNPRANLPKTDSCSLSRLLLPLAALLSSRERCSDEHEAAAAAWAERVLEQDQRAAGQAGGSTKQAQQDVCMLEGLLKVLSALVARAVEKEGTDAEDARSEAAHRRTLLVRAQALHLRKRLEAAIPEVSCRLGSSS